MRPASQWQKQESKPTDARSRAAKRTTAVESELHDAKQPSYVAALHTKHTIILHVSGATSRLKSALVGFVALFLSSPISTCMCRNLRECSELHTRLLPPLRLCYPAMGHAPVRDVSTVRQTASTSQQTWPSCQMSKLVDEE